MVPHSLLLLLLLMFCELNVLREMKETKLKVDVLVYRSERLWIVL